jgi:hypothetical protein
MPMPMLEIELAIRMTVKATLLKTPHRDSPPDESDPMLDSVDNWDSARANNAESPEGGSVVTLKWRAIRPVSRRIRGEAKGPPGRGERLAGAQPRPYIACVECLGLGSGWAMRLLRLGFVARLAADVGLGVIASVFLTPAWASEVKMADSDDISFASRAEAEAFLSRAIPAATAANPKYRSPGQDVLTQWLTKSISFREAQGGSVIVSIHETNDQYRDGALVKPGTHEATFAIDDVTVSLETSDQDVTEGGEKAEGVLFRCVGAPCIEAVWDGQKSMSGWTDIYLQEPKSRAQIFAAFQALQRKPPTR